MRQPLVVVTGLWMMLATHMVTGTDAGAQPLALTLTLATNEASYSEGDVLVLLASASGTVETEADLHVVVVDPEGQLFSLAASGGIVPGLVPVARRLSLPGGFDFPMQPIASFVLPAIRPGTYSWYGAFTRPGTLEPLSNLAQAVWTFLPSPPEMVSLTFPVAGSTLVGPITVSATAADSVVGVDFLLDGNPLGTGAVDPAGQWTMQWDVTTAPNGNHTLSAVAHDAAGGVATASAVVTVWTLSSRQASVFTPKPLPTIRDRLGLYPGDFVWFGQVPSSTVVTMGYMTQDRDLLKYHDLDWFLTYHPDWLMYKCDGVTPIRYWTDPQLAIDITNPAVREYQYNVIVRAYMNYGVDGIALDNFSFNNHFGRCGAYDAQGNWQQRYSGAFVDGAFAEDVLDWILWLAERVRADQGLVAINVIASDLLHPDFERLASHMDLVYFEGGGFIASRCAPAWTDDEWLRRFQAIRKVAIERAMVIQDEACDYMSQLTPELVSWDVANFFLVRGDRSYFAITQSYANRPVTDPDYDGPELHAPLGEPTGEPQQQGILWTRQYQKGLVAVNPSSTETAILSLGAGVFTDVYGQTFTGDIVMQPTSGVILLAAEP